MSTSAYLIALTLLFSLQILPTSTFDPDERLTFSQFIASRGFRLLNYTATTSDGYLLTIHRVVSLDFNPKSYSLTRKPVIAFHGIICQSPVFFYNSPFLESNDSVCGDNFGFCLAKSGRYDIWVPNARGNGFSNEHLWMNSKTNRSYWDFSWEHIGLNDIPAVIDLVLTETGHTSLGYVGYSQGAGTLFALLSLKPEYAQKISTFVAWAPAVYFHHARSIIRPFLRIMEPYFKAISGQYLFTDRWFNEFSRASCRFRLNHIFCRTFIEEMFGPSKNLNSTRLPVYTHFSPSPCSRWQLAHYGQIGESGVFARFDYKQKNIEIYGQSTPPAFPLEKIPKNIPTLIIYGKTDWFIDQHDVMRLVEDLKNFGWLNLDSYRVQAETWNHLDFLAGSNSGALVNDQTLEFLDRNFQ